MELEKLRSTYEKSLQDEVTKSNSLRKQLKQVNLAAEDTIWELQESNAELRSKLEDAQNRLVEVETFLSSDRGAVLLNLEEELAASKMRIAELEAEKDDLELEVVHRRRAGASTGKENSAIVNGTAVSRARGSDETRFKYGVASSTS